MAIIIQAAGRHSLTDYRTVEQIFQLIDDGLAELQIHRFNLYAILITLFFYPVFSDAAVADQNIFHILGENIIPVCHKAVVQSAFVAEPRQGAAARRIMIKSSVQYRSSGNPLSHSVV